jgi:hypothetical protein
MRCCYVAQSHKAKIASQTTTTTPTTTSSYRKAFIPVE